MWLENTFLNLFEGRFSLKNIFEIPQVQLSTTKKFVLNWFIFVPIFIKITIKLLKFLRIKFEFKQFLPLRASHGSPDLKFNFGWPQINTRRSNSKCFTLKIVKGRFKKFCCKSFVWYHVKKALNTFLFILTHCRG